MALVGGNVFPRRATTTMALNRPPPHNFDRSAFTSVGGGASCCGRQSSAFARGMGSAAPALPRHDPSCGKTRGRVLPESGWGETRGWQSVRSSGLSSAEPGPAERAIRRDSVLVCCRFLGLFLLRRTCCHSSRFAEPSSGFEGTRESDKEKMLRGDWGRRVRGAGTKSFLRRQSRIEVLTGWAMRFLGQKSGAVGLKMCEFLGVSIDWRTGSGRVLTFREWVGRQTAIGFSRTMRFAFFRSKLGASFDQVCRFFAGICVKAERRPGSFAPGARLSVGGTPCRDERRRALTVRSYDQGAGWCSGDPAHCRAKEGTNSVSRRARARGHIYRLT